MKKQKIINHFNIVFFILAALLIITRFYKIPNFFYFGVDEEYQALLSWSIVKDFHILWIGVSASDIGYYLGPGLTYLGALLLWLTKGNPISYAYFASSIGVLTGLSLYYIAKQIYDQKIALISLFLYIFSPFAFYYDRRYWPIAVPLIALWLFYSLAKAFKNPRWLFLTAFLIGLSYHIHITLWLFWPFIIYTFFISFIKKKINIFYILYSIFIFIVATLPLLVFDLVHNFDNLRLPLKLLAKLQDVGTSKNSINRLIEFVTHLKNIFIPSAFSNPVINCIFFGLLIICFIFFIKQGKKLLITNYCLLFTCSLIILFFFSFIFFPSPMQEYYFVLPLPFVILITANILNRAKFLTYFILSLFLIVNLYSFLKQPIYSDYLSKLKIIKQSTAYMKKDQFFLEVEEPYLFNGGWRYLFQVNNLIPSQSNADNVFGWVYPDEISSQKAKYKIVISKNKNLKLKTSLLKKFAYGLYSTYILRND